MKPEKFFEIVNSLGIEKNKWVTFSEISSILLKNGKGIYPNRQFMRFLITDKNTIFIKHGTSEAFGSSLISNFSFPYDYSSIIFPPRVPIIIREENMPLFREPVKGDILRVSSSGKTLEETIISEVLYSFNETRIRLVSPLRSLINYQGKFNLSFYNPEKKLEEDKESEFLDHYSTFYPNQGKNKKGYGAVEEIIKIKDIVEINFKITISNPYKILKIR